MNVKFMKLIFFFLVFFALINCNGYIRKNKKRTNYKKRNLQTIKECIDNYLEKIFVELNIYFDKLNLLKQTQNLDKYELLFNNMEKVANILKSFLKINRGYDPSVSIEDTSKEFGVEEWNRNLINDGLDYENGMFNQGISFIIWFKFGESGTMGNEIFYAEPIILDNCNQPEVGLITLNPDFDYSKVTEDYLKIYILHKFTHLLAFHYKMFLITFDDETSDLNEEDLLKQDTSGNYYIQSPKVMEFARKYFGCTDETKLDRIPVEVDEKGNIHWSARLLLGDYMTDLIYPEEKVISGFTLAFLEDIGYFELNTIYTGGLMRFGKNQGCDFINKNCYGDTDGNNDMIKFGNDFYYPTTDNINSNYETPSCSSGRLSKTIYKLIEYETGDEIPSSYNYFDNNLIGGYSPVNYCPVSQFFSSNTLSIGYCSDNTKTPNEERGESFSSNSFCALSSLLKETNANSPSILATCFEMFCSEKSLTIKVGNDYFVCPREGGKINGVGYKGYLLCPDFNLICTGTKICNNLFGCIEEESKEKESSFLYTNNDDSEDDYSSITTQDSTIYNGQTHTIGWELAENGECPKNCAQCKQNNNEKICVNCRPEYVLIGSKESQEVNCIQSSELGNSYYKDTSNNVYYPCISNCEECENGITCITCSRNYKLENDICVNKVTNCEEYDVNEVCIGCNTNYGLVKEQNNEISCQKLTDLRNTYYTFEENGKTYYIKCSDTISNCNTCTSGTTCISCIDGYGILNADDGNCVEITNEYYYDSDLGIYKLCSYKNQGCKKCTKTGTNTINCLECDTDSNYALVYSEFNLCFPQAFIANDKSIFMDSKTLKFYSCTDNRYHSVDKCFTCKNNTKCESCQNNYEISNSNELCISNTQISDKLYFKDSTNNNYYLCSDKINGCEKCQNAETCLECHISFELDENNKCIPTALALTRYYLNSDTGKYESCQKISNCEECSSSTECTRCKSGYELDNNICQKNENKNEDSYKSLAIGAIILGCFAIVISIGAIILIFLKKLFLKNSSDEVKKETESVNIKVEEMNDIVIQTNKRSIHNDKKNSE